MSFQPTSKQELQTAVDNWVLPDGDPNKDSSTYNNVPINDWDTSLITDMSSLFSVLRNTNTDTFNDYIGNWNTSNVKNMNYMFRRAIAFNQNINTKTINEGTDNEYTAWDVSKVDGMVYMFSGYISDTGSYIYTSFNQPLDKWDVSNVIIMYNMFSFSEFNQDINDWDVSNVQFMDWMFFNSSLNQSLNNWVVSNVSNMVGMLDNSALSVENYDTTLNGWASQIVQPDVTLGAYKLKYSSSGVLKRTKLINDYTWNITGDIFQPQNTDELKTAVNEWIDNNSQALINYGEINTWDTSLIDDMSNLFENKETFNDDIGNWDTSNVENMYSMFRRAVNFNKSLNSWNVSKVTNMQYMFAGYISDNDSYIYSSFNQPLYEWDVSNVIQMGSMFTFSEFNQDINGWDVSNVKFINWMFHHAKNFNQQLSIWNVSNVTQMGGMFHSAKIFNGNISNWTTTNVTTMHYLFSNTNEFNQNISGWDTSNVTYMSGVFNSADKFNQNISSWDTSKVIIMSSMFRNTDSFNQELITTENGWNTSNVTIMSNMFNNAKMFNQSLDTWDISNINNNVDMSVFNNVDIYNDITTAVTTETEETETTMEGMLDNSALSVENYDTTLNGWASQIVQPDVTLGAYKLKYSSSGVLKRTKLINDYTWNITGDIFQPQNTDELKTAVNEWIDNNSQALINYGEINTWDTSLIDDMSNLFENKETFNDDIGNWDTSNVENMYSMFRRAVNFNKSLNSWNVSKVTNMQYMFAGYISDNDSYIYSSFNQPLYEWDVSNVIQMGSMFTFSEFNQDINGWDVSNVKFINWMFHHAKNFNQQLSIWNVSNVTQMGGMFHSAKIFNGNISNWTTTNVTTMHYLFSNTNEFNQNISGWDTSNVTYMSGVFNSADKFNQNISSWDTSKVIIMSSMFRNTDSFNQELITTENGWNTSNVKIMSNMFNNAKMFNQSLDTWDISNINNNVDMSVINNDDIFDETTTPVTTETAETEPTMEGMLDNSALSVENYDNTLIGWAFQPVQPNVILGALNLQYSSSGELARNVLINEPNNWDIQGDTLICFMKNTMILILENGIEVERKVQELKNDDMVKISTDEYKKLVFIGTKTIDITKNIDKIRIMKQGILGNNLPNKDLLVTSGHSLLFNNLNYANEFYKSEFYDNNVEDYYKIMSQHCKLFEYVKEEELEDIIDGDNVSYYHFCLENEDEEGQYGVYSNGVLSETMALKFSKKNF
jgi:surface protein